MKTDQELLREYAETGSEGAFKALLERHLDLVFSTALRGLNDPGAAQEITQNVFMALARKAVWLTGESSVAGWLHKTALLEVRSWWRGELRRQRREKTAVELGTIMQNEESLLKSLTGELDEGLLALREGERQALILRYMEGRSHREIGLLLGAREDAVRMRIEKALVRLTDFFRRRGYAVPSVAMTVTVLGATVNAAPTGLALLATRSALATGSGAMASGLKSLLIRVLGLSKAQLSTVCIILAVAPVAWEWNRTRSTLQEAAAIRASVQTMRDQQDQLSVELERLRAESARLDGALTEAEKNAARYEAAARKLDTLKARLRGLLPDANYRWPADLPYVRVPKAAVKSLDLVHHMPFTPAGQLSEAALELLAITSEEKAPTEQALARYWAGVEDLMAASAYETNLPALQPGRLTKSVIVPPLGEPLKTLAQDTRAQLTAVLGSERERLLFAGWEEGAIQFFSPGNLWKISEEMQTLTAWVEPGGGKDSKLRYGGARQCRAGSTSAEGPGSLSVIPNSIATRFFKPWLEQFGINYPQ